MIGEFDIENDRAATLECGPEGSCVGEPRARLHRRGTRQNGGELRFDKSPPKKADEAEFIMLKDGGIAFEGNATELRDVAATDPYIHAFLS